MKTVFLLLLSFCISLFSYGQTPKTISYQGVARNSIGQPIPNQSIKIKLSLLETATSSNSLYTETHSPTTTGQGLFALQIGTGTVLSGTYSTLDWSNGPKFVKTEIDPTGGNNFTLSSTNPLNAVPFALFAASGTPGPQGPAGAQGPIGLTGPQGPTGAAGTQGVQGIAGANGKSVLSGTSAPPSATGTIGDFYINTATNQIFGPKAANGWGTGTNLVGPQGPAGQGLANGSATNQIMYWNGTTWTTLNPGSNGQTLTLCNGTLTWTTDGICPGLASLTTTNVSSVTSTTATCGGNISNEGSSAVTARGICWSTSQNPTIALSTKTVDGSGTGSFTSNLTGLSQSTVYYVRAYATNSTGTAYGNQQTVTTNTVAGGVFNPNLTYGTMNDNDGNTYKTIVIGTQTWMAENLKTSKYRNGYPIPTNLTDATWTSTTSGAYAIYDNDAANNTIYGKLYNWYAVVDIRNLCPVGWHIPSDAEWTTLENYLGGSSVAGGKLKSEFAPWTSPNTSATNESGFSGLPGGYRIGSGNYGGVGAIGYWWSSTEFSAALSWCRFLYYDYGNSVPDKGNKQIGFNVRCLKD